MISSKSHNKSVTRMTSSLPIPSAKSTLSEQQILYFITTIILFSSFSSDISKPNQNNRGQINVLCNSNTKGNWKECIGSVVVSVLEELD